ncbi:hypothetical protein [Mesobacillus subterraneus]|uniref:Uncharacterized protein n=1 Tax=Mesobacillus subterraneus TaxID=285983 RepID=A0A427TMG1_9BACI|nr:hypothetical protein [Mesobacillus subterraneus]RSD25517.1 hypothetical protein EJA10_17075 [Mesobacillus subterraneus]
MKQAIVTDIIEEVTAGIYRDYPNLLEKYGEQGRQKCKEDNVHHIKYLQTAFSMGEDQYFIDYAHWLNGILTSRGMKTDHLVDNFERLKAAFANLKEEESSTEFISMLDCAILSLQRDESNRE